MDLAAAPVSPQLDLTFARHPDRGTFLDRRVFRWPYSLARTFRLDDGPAGMLTLVLQTVSGSIQAGDALLQHLRVGEGAAVHLATQGATSVHRAPPGTRATEMILATVEDGALLEYLPDPRILFPDASLSQRIEVRLGRNACAILSDAFLPHDPLGQRRAFRHLDSEVAVRTREGELLALDRIALDAPSSRAGARAPYVAHGTLTIACRTGPAAAKALAGTIMASLAAIDGLYGAASPLPNDAGVALRLAAVDGGQLRRGLRAGWSAARHSLFGREPSGRGRSE